MSEELQKTDNQYLDLIRQVVTNPDVPVEKIKALMDMQLLLEDRRAEKEFDAAMIEAQKKIGALSWDKFNQTNQSHNVSYPKIEKMIKPIREEFGFSQSYTTEISPNPGEMIMVAIVTHKGGHRARYPLPMPIDGSGPKGGGVMTKPQAVGNGTSYGMRYLSKMIWNIPMLVDKDDNDGNAPQDFISKKQVNELRTMCQKIDAEQEARLCKYFKCESLEELPASQFNNALAGLAKKIREANNDPAKS